MLPEQEINVFDLINRFLFEYFENVLSGKSAVIWSARWYSYYDGNDTTKTTISTLVNTN